MLTEHDVSYLKSCPHGLNAVLLLQLNLNNTICHLCWKKCLVLSQEELFYIYINISKTAVYFNYFFRTVRTWDVNNEKKHKSVFKPRSVQGKRVIPTTCTYSRDGKLIAAGCQDGSIQIWDRNMSVSAVFDNDICFYYFECEC